MHEEILTKEQPKLLPIVQLFAKKFGLVGGTAIALHLGHRESLDYEMFSADPFQNASIKTTIKRATIGTILVNKRGEFTFLINGVKFTFFHFPYPITFAETLGAIVKIPDLLTLAAMKAFALGRRAKWKDYVDLYFILRAHHTVTEITAKGREVFGTEFNEKIFRVQLAYFADIDYSEEVVFREGYATDDDTIKRALEEYSVAM